MDRTFLLKKWIHSHEEDEGNKKVFRPQGYAFPLSRGRSGFKLHSNSSMNNIQPGPADIPISNEGNWELIEGKENILCVHESGTSPLYYKIDSISEDKLVLEPLDM